MRCAVTLPAENAMPVVQNRCGVVFCLGMVLLLALWVGLVGRTLWHPDDRIIFRDSNLMGVPNLQYLGEALHEGFIPWIHPRRGCGTPFLADPQTQTLYLPAWIFALFPPVMAFKMHQFIHLLLLGVGFALLARIRGVTAAGSLCAGAVAVAAQSNLVQAEWLPTLAGSAWVPWTLLAAMTGSAGWWVFCAAMMISSGYAYVWVMAPVIIAAGLLLVPEAKRRRFYLMALLLPAITAPCWMGYFTLTGDAKPHGMSGADIAPVRGFALWHLSFFLMPRGIEPYSFYHADGRIGFFPVESELAWSFFCYLGVVPLLLGLYAAFLPAPGRRAVWCMGAGGLAMAFGIGYLGNISGSVNQAIHHPATFIQLVVWALLFAWPIGWQMLDSPAGSDRIRTPARAWLWLGLALSIAFGIHYWMSRLALEDAVSTYWNHTFNVGWTGWLIAGLTALLAWEASRMRLAATGLLLVAVFDVYAVSPMVLPLTDSKPPAPRMTEGIEAGSGRLRLQKDFIEKVLGTTYRRYQQKVSYLEWLPSVGYPNSFARFGIHQFDDYNPPFVHEALTTWAARLDAATGTPAIDTLRRISGVRYIVSATDMASLSWKLLATTSSPVGTWTARLYDAGPTSGAVIMPLSALISLDLGGVPASSSLIPVNIRWQGQRASAVLPAGGTVPPDSLLFVPVTPWIGWTPTLDGLPVAPIVRRGFGLAIPIASGSRSFELRFRQPWACHALFAAMAGILGVWLTGRRKPVFDDRRVRNPKKVYTPGNTTSKGAGHVH